MYVLSISEQEGQVDEPEDQIHERLFPEQTERPVKIRKPVVFLNCRIHPGEVTASHTLNGII